MDNSHQLLPNQILILFAHPALEKSRVNRQLIRAVEGLEAVTIRDLYRLIPTFISTLKQNKICCWHMM